MDLPLEMQNEGTGASLFKLYAHQWQSIKSTVMDAIKFNLYNLRRYFIDPFP